MQSKPTSLVETGFVDIENTGPAERIQYLTSVDDPKSTFVAVVKAGETLYLDRFNRVDIFILKGTLITKNGIIFSKHTLIAPQECESPSGGAEGATVLVYAEQSPSLPYENGIMTRDDLHWVDGAVPNMELAILKTFPHRLMLIKWKPGAKVSQHAHPSGEEIFVLDGELKDANWHGAKAGSWQRFKPGSTHTPYADENTLILVRQGHLGVR